MLHAIFHWRLIRPRFVASELVKRAAAGIHAQRDFVVFDTGFHIGLPLGRDEFGRDVLSRLIWGARTSLAVAFASALIAGIVGTALGLMNGVAFGIGSAGVALVGVIVTRFGPDAALTVVSFAPLLAAAAYVAVARRR